MERRRSYYSVNASFGTLIVERGNSDCTEGRPGPTVAREPQKNGITGIALAAAVGFGIGLVAGLVAGEWLGGVHPERIRRAVRRLGPQISPARDPQAVERAVLRALKSDPRTGNLRIGVRAISDGLVELTGTVPAPELRRHAAEIAQAAAGDDVVVNRLLVEGEDVG